MTTVQIVWIAVAAIFAVLSILGIMDGLRGRVIVYTGALPSHRN